MPLGLEQLEKLAEILDLENRVPEYAGYMALHAKNSDVTKEARLEHYLKSVRASMFGPDLTNFNEGLSLLDTLSPEEAVKAIDQAFSTATGIDLEKRKRDAAKSGHPYADPLAPPKIVRFTDLKPAPIDDKDRKKILSEGLTNRDIYHAIGLKTRDEIPGGVDAGAPLQFDWRDLADAIAKRRHEERGKPASRSFH